MDASNQKDNSPDTIRERVESKRDEFAGGPEPGWQQMEAAAGQAQSSGASATATANTAAQAPPAQGTAQTAPQETEGIPFNDEHPIGIGQQCFKCGAYNELEAQTCWNCSAELTHTAVETPGVVESVQPTEDVTPIGSTTGDGTGSPDSSDGARPISQ